MKRRDFLKAGFNASLLWGLGSQGIALPRAWANNCTPRAPVTDESVLGLIVLNFEGGWATQLSLDPLTPEMARFQDRLCDEQDLYFNHQWLSKKFLFPFGSGANRGYLGAAAAPLLRHASELCVLRGFIMSEQIGHPINRDLMGAGSSQTKAPFIPFAIAEGNSRYGFKGVYLEKKEPVVTGRAQTITPEKLSLEVASLALPATELEQVQIECESAQALALDMDIQELYLKALQMPLEQSLIRKSWDLVTDEIHRQPRLAKSLRWLPLVAGFLSGACRSAYIDVPFEPLGEAKSPDTHKGYLSAQMPVLESGFESAALLIDLLKAVEVEPGVSLLSKVVVVGTSEFSRSPWNEPDSEVPGIENDGTAHNVFSNSAFLLGANIRGNTIVGANQFWSRHSTQPIPYGVLDTKERSLIMAAPVDFKQGRPLRHQEMAHVEASLCVGNVASDGCTQFLTPAHLWNTVLRAMRVQNRPLHLDSTSLIPGILT